MKMLTPWTIFGFLTKIGQNMSHGASLFFDRSSRRKRGMASNPLTDFFLHFPNELLKEMGTKGKEQI